MFLAFNKDALVGKTFQDFGKGMEAKYGNAREVFRDERVRGGGIKRILDHYEWSAGGGDRLKLVDRSEFYGVFCLVLYDGSVQDRVNERRKVVNPGDVKHDDLVESVTAKDKSAADQNDDIIDRVVGKEVKKPGEEKHADIVVPSQTGKAVSPKEVNAKSRPHRPRSRRRRQRRRTARRRAARSPTATRWTAWSCRPAVPGARGPPDPRVTLID
jgi:hypothetical protein